MDSEVKNGVNKGIKERDLENRWAQSSQGGEIRNTSIQYVRQNTKHDYFFG